jgi:hypothetical protein
MQCMTTSLEFFRPIFDKVHLWRANWIGIADEAIDADELHYWSPVLAAPAVELTFVAAWLYENVGLWGAMDHASNARWDVTCELSYESWLALHIDSEPILLNKPPSLAWWTDQITQLIQPTYSNQCNLMQITASPAALGKELH